MKISFRCFNRKFLQFGYMNSDPVFMTSLLIKKFVQCHCLDCHTDGAIIGTIIVNCSVVWGQSNLLFTTEHAMEIITYNPFSIVNSAIKAGKIQGWGSQPYAGLSLLKV